MLDINNDKLTVVLLIVIALLGILNLNKDMVGMNVLELGLEDRNFEIKDNVINLNSLTLKQKIGQMIFTLAKPENKDLLQEMNVGGIYFWKKNTENTYSNDIRYFQENMEIPFFVGVDLEGCWNPFEDFYKFPMFKEIKDENEAYELGKEQGLLLKKLGFNINFSPVVDREDKIWKCRSFEGDIERKAAYYVRGLQNQGIIATAKHYPGKTLIGKDPHKDIEFTIINEDDLKPFEWTIKSGVKAVMINHLISRGAADSEYKPSVVSKSVISGLKKDFTGLVLTDEVRMAGLKDFYGDERRMYVDLVNAGNDVILDFNAEPWHIYKIVAIIENAINLGEIKEDRIDDAVTNILKTKGFKVVKRKL